MNRNIYKYFAIGFSLLFITWVNFDYIVSHLSSNSEIVTNYTKKIEPLDDKRLAVAGYFYSDKILNKSTETDNYLKNRYNPDLFKPRILIIPHSAHESSLKVVGNAFSTIEPYAKTIKNVVILSPSCDVTSQDLVLTNANGLITSLGRVNVNQGINNELASQEGLVVRDYDFSKDAFFNNKLPILQKALNSFSIIPIRYGKSNPQNIADLVEPYLNRSDVLLIISADLENSLSKQPSVNNGSTCNLVGIDTAIILAKKMNLKSKILSEDVGLIKKSKAARYGDFLYKKMRIKPKMILAPLEKEVESLEKFIGDNSKDLLDVISASINDALLHDKKFKPSRKKYNDSLFNKGAVFVDAIQDGKVIAQEGSLIPEKAVALDIAQNIYKVFKNNSNVINQQNIKILKIKVYILTSYEAVKYSSELDLLKKLTQNIDGVVIRDGDRQAVFLPSEWKNASSKEEFLKNLKLKAGLSPIYWSNDIKIYKFRTVEVNNNEN